MTDEQPFKRELAEYERQKDALLARAAGQYIAVQGETLIGPYPSYGDAFVEATRTFGDDRFLIKQILPNDPVSFTPTIGTVKSDAVFNCLS